MGCDTEFYVCGPAPFEAMVREALQGLGASDAAIRSEAFAARERTGRGPAVQAAEVRFVRSGISAAWRADQDLSLLDLAEEAGIVAPFSCREGLCQTCETRLPRGDVAYDPEPAARPRPGHALICCARPASAMVELDL
jgi:ferredoxin